MEQCCHTDEVSLAKLWSDQSRTLRIVLAINALMFFVELVAGIAAASVALLADSLDMLGDALVYGFSLYVIGRSPQWRASAALLKGAIMLAFGIGVLAEVAWKLVTHQLPTAPAMLGVGLAALAANGVCLALLTQHRTDDINMRSTWLCSRNDIAANVGVLLAAGGVHWMRSIWPDIVVGLVITGLFVWSAADVLKDACRALHSRQ